MNFKQKKSPIKQKISLYLESKAISSYEFYKGSGVTRGILSQENGISEENLSKFLEYAPDVDIEWLLTGRGEMIRRDISPASKKELMQLSSEVPIAIPASNLDKGIPLIPIFAEAGILRGEVSIMDYECEHYVIPSLRNADFLIHVHGDSMVPTYLPGDLVACKRVYLSNLFFQWNKTYVLDTNQGVIIKRVKKSTQADSILAVSDNKDYDPFDIPMSCIYTVAIVLGLVRLE